MKKNLTNKQLQVLGAIEYFIKNNGYSPTYKEIAILLHKTITPVFRQIMILEEKGYIQTNMGGHRTIKLIKKDIENE